MRHSVPTMGQVLDNPEESFGYTVMGPLVPAFAHWLRSRRAARPQGRLVFLARDMYLVREGCRLLGEAGVPATSASPGAVSARRCSCVP